jgi:hypothetical protein
MARKITIGEQCTSEVGNCNGCDDRTGPGQRYRVWEVKLTQMSFRLCDTCLLHFQKQMAPATVEAAKVAPISDGADNAVRG